MEERSKRNVLHILLPSLLAIALGVAVWWGFEQKAEAADYRNLTQSMYRRAYGDLSDSLYDMESNLAKLQAVNTPAQRILLLDEIWRLSGGAVSSMSQIPSLFLDTEALNQFVVRVGDYAHALTKKTMAGEELTQEEVDSISQLRDTCHTLAQDTAQRLADGDIPLEAVTAEDFYSQTQTAENTGENTQADAQEDAGVMEFPTLIYDGPFSESAEKLEPKGLRGEDISQEEAQQRAQAFTGRTLTCNGLVEASIPAYDFSYSDENGGWLEIQITRQGGDILWFMSPSSSNVEGRPPEAEAGRYRDAALAKLEELGYLHMQATYAQYYGGVAVINCAATQGDVILYSDLIKVWVDRQTLEVVGMDARNYLFSHVDRRLQAPAISAHEAEARVSPQLEIQSQALALIPLTPETERLCYEFKCTMGGDSYILYIDAQDGSEAQVFRIIDSEDGTLVI